jgi:glutamate dehydrogenase/leucine dehydrogenase
VAAANDDKINISGNNCYLFQVKKLRDEFTGMLTGKGVNWGGSFIQPEATSYGLIYFVEHISFLRFSFYPINELFSLR